jgi:hypothetical protein
VVKILVAAGADIKAQGYGGEDREDAEFARRSKVKEHKSLLMLGFGWLSIC